MAVSRCICVHHYTIETGLVRASGCNIDCTHPCCRLLSLGVLVGLEIVLSLFCAYTAQHAPFYVGAKSFDRRTVSISDQPSACIVQGNRLTMSLIASNGLCRYIRPIIGKRVA